MNRPLVLLISFIPGSSAAFALQTGQAEAAAQPRQQLKRYPSYDR